MEDPWRAGSSRDAVVGNQRKWSTNQVGVPNGAKFEPARCVDPGHGRPPRGRNRGLASTWFMV